MCITRGSKCGPTAKGLYEITDEVQSKIDKCGSAENGTVTVFVQHTSCSIVIMENADPTARRDLEEVFRPPRAGKMPITSRTMRKAGDDMPSHIRMVPDDAPARPCRLWTEKCSSERGKGIFLLNTAEHRIGGKFFITIMGE
jgi:secondary thiamine-phosphate synthase enzyme